MKHDGQQTGDTGTQRVRALLVLAALFALLVAPMLLIESGRPAIGLEKSDLRKGLPSELKDQDDYHLPVIATMAAQWPRPDVVRYESATAPGYHLLMAMVSKAVPGGARAAPGDAGKPAAPAKAPMLIVNALCGLGLVLIVAWHAMNRVGPWHGAMLALPLMMSPYVLGGSIWLTTDNLALLLALAALGGACMGTAPSAQRGPWRGIGLGLLAAGAVAVRQIHLWLCAPLVLIAVLRGPLRRFVPRALRDEPAGDVPRGWGVTLAGLTGAALPAALLAVFAVLWGGLMPQSESIRARHLQGANLAAVPLCLAVLGVYGAAFALPGLVRARRDRLVWICGALAALVAAAVPSSWSRPSRDYGWLWEIAERTPSVAERSVALTVLAGVGGAVLAVLWRGACAQGRRWHANVLLLSLLGWLLAQSMNSMAWQRYVEPVALAALAWLAALGSEPRQPGLRRAIPWGAVAVGGLLLALSAITQIAPVVRAWAGGAFSGR